MRWAQKVVVAGVALVLLAAAGAGLGCLKTVPAPMAEPAELAPLTANNPADNLRNVTLGPQGRFVMLGEFSLRPETVGLDLTTVLSGATSISSGAIWCVEPVSFVGDSLVLSVGMTWWPPMVEPNWPTRSITEGLMRCLGFLEAKAWNRATVYLSPASVPRVEPTQTRPPVTQGTQTLEAALEQAFLFGVAAPFHARGLALQAGTQDGLYVDEDRGVRRRAEAHVVHADDTWQSANRIFYSVAENTARLDIVGLTSVGTVIDGASYVVGSGILGELMPREITRAAMRVRAGLSQAFISMTARARARASPGLTCVARTLSRPGPRFFAGEMGQPGQGDESEAAANLAQSIDGGVIVTRHYPGVDLDAALKCELDDEESSGPIRTFE